MEASGEDCRISFDPATGTAASCRGSIIRLRKMIIISLPFSLDGCVELPSLGPRLGRDAFGAGVEWESNLSIGAWPWGRKRGRRGRREASSEPCDTRRRRGSDEGRWLPGRNSRRQQHGGERAHAVVLPRKMPMSQPNGSLTDPGKGKGLSSVVVKRVQTKELRPFSWYRTVT